MQPSGTHDSCVTASASCTVLCREAHSESSTVRVAYATREGQLIGSDKDVATDTTSGELVFGPDEDMKYIYVYPFQDDDMEYEIGEGFMVDLKPIEGCDIRLHRASVLLSSVESNELSLSVP